MDKRNLEDQKPDDVFFAVVDIAEHSGFTTSRRSTDAWLPENPDGWTYQDMTGAHGTVIYEGPDESEAERVLAERLECDSAEKGTYCYTHNPGGGS